MSGEQQRVVVIGAGVSGLAAAHHLRSRFAVTVLEASDRTGGTIHSIELDGIPVECGADGFVASRPEINELCGVLGVGLADSDDRDGRASILREGMLHPLPHGFRGIAAADPAGLLRTALLSPAGRLRAAWGARRDAPEPSDDVSVAELVSDHLGPEAYRNIMEPLVTGVAAGDPTTISSAALLRPRPGPSPGSKSGPAFRKPAGGMSRLIDALAAAVGDVRLGWCAQGVAPHADAPGYMVAIAGHDPIEASAVVVATPSDAAARLTTRLAPDVSRELAGLRQVSTAVVTLIIPGQPAPQGIGHGYVIPRSSRRQSVAVTVASRKFPDPAAAGSLVLRVFIGRDGDPNPLGLTDDSLVDVARTEVRATLGIPTEPAAVHVARWEGALPQYDLGHLARVARIQVALESHPRLALAGSAYRGIGVPDCIASGREAADRVTAALTG